MPLQLLTATLRPIVSMSIKDIVNRDLVDLENCESEPIHIPGSIQPHGFLIGVHADTFQIEFCSGNVNEHTGMPYDELLGKDIASILGAEQLSAMQKYLDALTGTFTAPLRLTLGGKHFETTIHRSGDVWVLEFEAAITDLPDLTALYTQTRSFVGYMEQATSLQMLCQAVADGTRRIIGYDRVMVYRFDEDYNGEVIAESKIEELESFLGLHYPHTDIPPQARELYRKNLIRVIGDVDYTPVPIYTRSSKTHKDLDLTFSILRSVSPIHVQYLHNMGVSASTSISLMHEGRLWGLIACHHYHGPQPINSHARIAARLQGHFMASQIGVRQIAEEYETSKLVNQSLDSLLAKNFDLDRSAFHTIANEPDLLDLCRARGVAIVLDDVIYRGGLTPGDSEIQRLAGWASENAVNGYLRTSQVHEADHDAEEACQTAAGIIYHALDKMQQNCIIWFRPETIHEVNWAGDPNKAIEKDRDQLSPRRSFQAWKQIVKCRSIEWEKPELNAAANYAHSLQKFINTLFLREEETKYRLLSVRLTEAYQELENLNWISTHDLKEPLRKIQVFASRILDAEALELPDSIQASLQKIQGSASRMQTLINDVLTYSRVRNSEDRLTAVSLDKIVQSVIYDLDDEIAIHRAMIDYDELPEVQGVSFLLAQLFSNLIRNSMKFTREGITPHIAIRYEGMKEYTPIEHLPLKLYHLISISDNGIGFEDKYSQSIFKVFNRLHAHDAFGGTGVGLALCKKIMETHNGFISARGVPGEGATFYLYFPV